ncbi:MAG: hypothetical protein AB8G77_08360 [Rhodothermales bacterium]
MSKKEKRILIALFNRQYCRLRIGKKAQSEHAMLTHESTVIDLKNRVNESARSVLDQLIHEGAPQKISSWCVAKNYSTFAQS